MIIARECPQVGSVLFQLRLLTNQFHGGPQPQEVGVDSESGDLTPRDRRNHGVMPELLPCVDIGHVGFDNEDLQKTASASRKA
jgi:hypothetical protein